MGNSLYERIAARLDQLGMSEREASLKATGNQDPDLIRNLKRTRSQDMKAARLLVLAGILKVNPQWLQSGEGNPSLEAGAQRAVPLLSWVSAGAMALADGQQETLGTVYESDLDGSGDWVALTVVGDSMDRISPPESIIFVDMNDKALVPNACYVIVNGDGEATYKRFRSNPMRFEPVSTNPAHEPLFFTDLPKVLGRVKKSTIQM